MKEMFTPEEYAAMLPGNVGFDDDARSRLLCVFEILKSFTDREHGLTSAQIREILEARSTSGKKPSEPSVLSDIKAISENSYPAIEVETPSRGKNGGFKCSKVLISSAQARLLINIVRTCKFITDEECESLCEALESMVSIYEQDKIVEEVYIDERSRPQGQDVYKAAEVVSEAMKLGKKISFEYCFYGLDGKEHLVEKADGSTVFTETPISLVFSYGNYYLETWPEEQTDEEHRFHFDRRLDRMRNPRVSKEKADSSKEIHHLKKTTSRRMKQTVDMFGDGKTRNIILEVDSLATNAVFARFGYDAEFEHISLGPNGRQKGYLWVQVQLSPTFFRWLFGMGEKVRIAKPKGPLWATSGSWKRFSDVNYSDLLWDYNDAKKQYIESLRSIANFYEN